VDKHSPRGFGELLSDERLNRQVLRWVKQWDGHVFGRGAATSASRSASRAAPPERPLPMLPMVPAGMIRED